MVTYRSAICEQNNNNTFIIMVVAVGEENRDPNIPTNNADAESTAAPAVVQQKTENAQANDDHPW